MGLKNRLGRKDEDYACIVRVGICPGFEFEFDVVK